jgi:hypothetical protein
MISDRKAAFSNTIRMLSGLLTVGNLSLCVHAQDASLNFQAAQAAADKGDAKAQYELGMYYGEGKQVRKDLAEAVKYIRLSADQGYAEAEVILGSLYGRGRGVPLDLKMAVALYRKAADQGNAMAQFAMGNFCATGRGMTNDTQAAIAWWQKAAAQKYVEAETALGKLFLLPHPLPDGTNYLNFAEAHHWLHLAAAQGSAEAMNNLGVAFDNGYGVKTDFAEAAKWYRAAAEQGDDQAQANLGQLYFEGRGVPLDLVQAYKWFRLSGARGNFRAHQVLEDYQGHDLLTPEQLANAEALYRNFQPQPAKNQP